MKRSDLRRLITEVIYEYYDDMGEEGDQYIPINFNFTFIPKDKKSDPLDVEQWILDAFNDAFNASQLPFDDQLSDTIVTFLEKRGNLYKIEFSFDFDEDRHFPNVSKIERDIDKHLKLHGRIRGKITIGQ